MVKIKEEQYVLAEEIDKINDSLLIMYENMKSAENEIKSLVNDINSSVDETENMNSIDSIFKSKINDFTAPEPYRASKLDQEVMRRSDNLPFEDTTFKPIARNDNFAMLDTSEKKAEKTSTSVFTSELERKEDVEIVDL